MLPVHRTESDESSPFLALAIFVIRLFNCMTVARISSCDEAK
jgi:hypothetical protein